MAILSACNLPTRSSISTQIINQNPVDSVATITLQVNPTRTQMAIIPPTFIATKVTPSPIATPIQRNAPVWSAYNYTCKLAVGGGDMTMNLTWSDRSNSEEGYRVYRDNQVIATLAPNSTSYVDVAFVATGKTLSYSVEAFNTDWKASTSTITSGCQ
jgi:hypothetical protein